MARHNAAKLNNGGAWSVCLKIHATNMGKLEIVAMVNGVHSRPWSDPFPYPGHGSNATAASRFITATPLKAINVSQLVERSRQMGLHFVHH